MVWWSLVCLVISLQWIFTFVNWLNITLWWYVYELDYLQMELQLPSNVLLIKNTSLVFNILRNTKIIFPSIKPTEAWIKLPPFCKRNSRVHFPEWKLIHLIQSSMKFIQLGPVDNKALQQHHTYVVRLRMRLRLSAQLHVFHLSSGVNILPPK